jgi:molecular chaperone DnaK
MRLGIDFGTTRTVVSAVDRGNYPVVEFEDFDGDFRSWYPATVATRGGRPLYGLDAEHRRRTEACDYLRSLKPLLADCAPHRQVSLGGLKMPLVDALSGYLAQLRRDLVERSSLNPGSRRRFEAWIAVPANANSNQRFLTMEAFRRAGFKVLGLLNEPSAAGVEYAHRYISAGGRQTYLVVYDLGGGTFDVSLIGLRDHKYEVLTSEGIGRLGGNDFDEVLLQLALRAGGLEGRSLTERERLNLLEECRERKEGLHPNTRKLVVDLGRGVEGAKEVVVPVTDYYARCGPLVERTTAATGNALRRLTKVAAGADAGADAMPELAAVYLVGGACALPCVVRQVRERFGRKVRKSTYPHAATAIGLARAADRAKVRVKERFTRHFGVWREAQQGRHISFDPIFPKDTPLPDASQPPLVHTRRYCPVHNIGHFRYLECSRVDEEGKPRGDIAPWDEILFPMDPELKEASRLERIPVHRVPALADRQLIEERYVCDAQGVIQVTIANRSGGYERTFQLRGRAG